VHLRQAAIKPLSLQRSIINLLMQAVPPGMGTDIQLRQRASNTPHLNICKVAFTCAGSRKAGVDGRLPLWHVASIVTQEGE
jgi:hypothetical protein